MIGRQRQDPKDVLKFASNQNSREKKIGKTIVTFELSTSSTKQRIHCELKCTAEPSGPDVCWLERHKRYDPACLLRYKELRGPDVRNFLIIKASHSFRHRSRLGKKKINRSCRDSTTSTNYGKPSRLSSWAAGTCPCRDKLHSHNHHLLL